MQCLFGTLGLHPDQIRQLHRPLTEVEQPISRLTASAIACMTQDQVEVRKK